MFIDACYHKNEIVVWLRDEDGKLHSITTPAPYYCYKSDPAGTMISMFGESVTKHEFQSKTALTQFASANEGIYESDISPIHKFLSDTFYKMPNTPINVGFLDIEVDYDLADGHGYPMPDDPFGFINALTLYNKTTKEFHQLYVYDVPVTIDVGEDCVLSYHCHSERQLFDTFFKIIEDIDILSGWNSDGYDLPYLVARARKLYGSRKADQLFCRDGHSIKEEQRLNEYKNEYIRYTLNGRTHIDYQDLYKNFTFQEKPSYSLENIAQDELSYGKIDYEGDLGELYRTDIVRFLQYNLHDVRLLRDLEHKLKFMGLAVTMSRQATILIPEILGTIKYIESSIRNYAHFDRDVPMVLPDRKNEEREGKFVGAWVCDPVANSYSWVSSIDLASLYPSIIRTLGIGQETFILQCVDREAGFLKITEKSNDAIDVIVKSSNEVISVRASDLGEMIKNEGYTISANGSIFDGRVSLISEVLGIWYEERKRMKKLSAEHYKAGDSALGDYYDTHQYIKKVNLNSLYGCISNQFSRFFDLDMAISVTLTGQHINKFQAWKSDQLINGLT